MTEKAKPDSDNARQTFAWVMLALVIVSGAIARVYGIDRQSLWSDELYALTASYKPFSAAWQMMLGDSHPPGFLSFIYFSVPFTGYTDFGVRLHALVFGISWIPLVFYIGKRWLSFNSGLFAAAIIAGAYNAIYYSQESRAYAMFVAFMLLNVICFLELMLADVKQRCYAYGFIATAILALYLHYAGLVFLATEALLYGILWLSGHRRGTWREALLMFGVPLIAYLPWAQITYMNIVAPPQDWSVSKAPTAAEIYNTIQRLFGPERQRALWTMGFVGLAIMVAVIQNLQQGISKRLLVVYCLVFLAAVPVLAFLVKSLLHTPIFEKRYFLGSLALAVVLAGDGMNAAVRPLFGERKKLAAVIVVFCLSVWAINSNVGMGLYSRIDKDPIREAVDAVKKDLAGKAGDKNYTTLMTHEFFEHYLRKSGIAFDSNWPYRHYYVPQQLANVDQYFSSHTDLDYFYYLSLRQPNAEAALVALKQQYKLLEKTQVVIEQGAFDIFKFSTKDRPDEEQIRNAGSNASNEVAALVEQGVAGKDPATYRVLMTHTWLQPYLRRHNVHFDSGWSLGNYVINAQSDGVISYVETHPEIDTLYYLALEEPNAEDAAFLLQAKYLLVEEKSVQTAVGKMNIFQFNTKMPPVMTESAFQRMQNTPTNKVAQWLAERVKGRVADSYAVLTSSEWLKPYLQMNGVALGNVYQQRTYSSDLSAQAVFDSVQQQAAVETLYYLALRNPESDRAALLLQARYQLVEQTVFDLPVGKVDVYQLSTRSKAQDIGHIREKMIDNPLNDLVLALATEQKKTGNKASAVVMTHGWFQPYLNMHEVVYDENWPGRFFTNPGQLDSVLQYLQAHPEIEHVYYLGLAEPGSQAALDVLKGRMAVACKTFIQSPMGMLKLLRLDTKTAVASGMADSTACGK